MIKHILAEFSTLRGFAAAALKGKFISTCSIPINVANPAQWIVLILHSPPQMLGFRVSV